MAFAKASRWELSEIYWVNSSNKVSFAPENDFTENTSAFSIEI